MKKILAIVAALILCACLYCIGRAAGIRHAIEDAQIWTVDRYDPDAPEESAWNGYDQRIFIDLDGQTYEHGMFQS